MDDKRVRHAQETYRINQIKTASREQLLLITYDIGIQACKMGEEAMGRGDVEETNEALKRAQSVVRELMVTLNVEVGGDVAKQLMTLYDFLYYELVHANVQKDMDRLVTVRTMLQELRQTWQEVADKLHAEEEEPMALPQEAVPGPKAVNMVAAGGRPLLHGGLNVAG